MATAVLRRPLLASLLPAAAARPSRIHFRRSRYPPPALAVSSDSPEPLTSSSSPGGDNPDEEPALPLLQELADCLVLPPKFLPQLPRDLRLDIAETMIKNGKLLSKRPVIQSEVHEIKKRKLKFGELEFELTAEKANAGAAAGLVFGFLSWQLAQGVQSIPDSPMQYANDNALQLAKSLKGPLLVLGYTSTLLSVFGSLGLLLLAQQINSENKSE